MASRLPIPPGNRLLGLIPDLERDRLIASGKSLSLDLRKTLYRSNEPIDGLYFPERGVVSIVRVMEDGAIVEIATIGNEGVVGIEAFLGRESTPGEAFVQVEGAALWVPLRQVREIAAPGTGLFEVLHRYTQGLLSQVAQNAACNRAHPIEQRCARWLLMTHDRVGAAEFGLTQEFLAQMLGVRRAGVSVAASILARAGFIRYTRGRITVVDREGLESASCECYGIIRDDLDALLPVGRPLSYSATVLAGRT
jgi:CRP-like cAMP-binding protein